MSEPTRNIRDFNLVEAHVEDGQKTLPISFPKELETYKVASPEFRTDEDLQPKLKVRVSGEGLVAKMSGTFGEEKDTVRWTIVLDSCDLEIL